MTDFPWYLLMAIPPVAFVAYYGWLWFTAPRCPECRGRNVDETKTMTGRQAVICYECNEEYPIKGA